MSGEKDLENVPVWQDPEDDAFTWDGFGYNKEPAHASVHPATTAGVGCAKELEDEDAKMNAGAAKADLQEHLQAANYEARQDAFPMPSNAGGAAQGKGMRADAPAFFPGKGYVKTETAEGGNPRTGSSSENGNEDNHLLNLLDHLLHTGTEADKESDKDDGSSESNSTLTGFVQRVNAKAFIPEEASFAHNEDQALDRRFQPVSVPEPTNEEVVQILRGIARKYEAHHGIRYSEEALQSCVKFAWQYIQDRYLLDKAIHLLDETGAQVQWRQLATVPEEALELRQELRDVEAQKEVAVRTQDFKKAAELKIKEDELQCQLYQFMKKGSTPVPVPDAVSEDSADVKSAETETVELPPLGPEDVEEALSKPTVTENDVAAVASAWTKDSLHNRVIGQEEAVTAIAKAVRRAGDGPIVGFIFCGPTGVGKTELCKALSEAYFGKEDAMIRLDMSEFMEKHTVAKLIQSQLTDPVRRKPYSLVLFDEVEKAHSDVFNLMLQVLEDGHLTDSKGEIVSFENTLIILTSSCGAKEIEKALIGSGLGFDAGADEPGVSMHQQLKSKVQEQPCKGFFRQEFLNRLDELIVFRASELEFLYTFKRCQERGITLSLDEGYHQVYGARPLRRAIIRLLDDKLAQAFRYDLTVEGECNKDTSVVVLTQCLPVEGKVSSDALEAQKHDWCSGGRRVPTWVQQSFNIWPAVCV